MASPTIGKSPSFKGEDEASKPKEKEKAKVVDPSPLSSQSVPLKETTSNDDAASTEGDATPSIEGVDASALELLQQEEREAKIFVEDLGPLGVGGAEAEKKAIQQDPAVAVLENGTSTDHRRCTWIAHNGYTYSPDASFFN
jgi:hypothetical protein